MTSDAEHIRRIIRHRSITSANALPINTNALVHIFLLIGQRHLGIQRKDCRLFKRTGVYAQNTP